MAPSKLRPSWVLWCVPGAARDPDTAWSYAASSQQQTFNMAPGKPRPSWVFCGEYLALPHLPTQPRLALHHFSSRHAPCIQAGYCGVCTWRCQISWHSLVLRCIISATDMHLAYKLGVVLCAWRCQISWHNRVLRCIISAADMHLAYKLGVVLHTWRCQISWHSRVLRCIISAADMR